MTSGSPVIRESIHCDAAGGLSLPAYTARPGGAGPHPAIIVLQEAFGVNHHIRGLADRLAEHGFVAIAPELFHRTAPGFEGDYTNFQSVMPHMQAITLPGLEADLRASYGWLESQPSVQKEEIFSVGFCMGGKVSFLANSILPLRAAVSFYGARIAPDLLDRAPFMHGTMLFFWGGLDHHITPEYRKTVIDALDVSKKTYVNVEFSNADHGFFCDERASYQPQAARQSWSLMMEFLK